MSKAPFKTIPLSELHFELGQEIFEGVLQERTARRKNATDRKIKAETEARRATIFVMVDGKLVKRERD